MAIREILLSADVMIAERWTLFKHARLDEPIEQFVILNWLRHILLEAVLAYTI
jgi:hypothetical protein